MLELPTRPPGQVPALPLPLLYRTVALLAQRSLTLFPPVPQLPVQPNPSLQRLASAAPVDVASSNAVHAPALPPAGPSPIDALPDLDSVLSLRVPTLQHVPKAVRDSWAHILSEVLSAIVSNPSEVGPWCKLFMLSKCLLANPARGGTLPLA